MLSGRLCEVRVNYLFIKGWQQNHTLQIAKKPALPAFWYISKYKLYRKEQFSYLIPKKLISAQSRNFIREFLEILQLIFIQDLGFLDSVIHHVLAKFPSVSDF